MKAKLIWKGKIEYDCILDAVKAYARNEFTRGRIMSSIITTAPRKPGDLMTDNVQFETTLVRLYAALVVAYPLSDKCDYPSNSRKFAEWLSDHDFILKSNGIWITVTGKRVRISINQVTGICADIAIVDDLATMESVDWNGMHEYPMGAGFIRTPFPESVFPFTPEVSDLNVAFALSKLVTEFGMPGFEPSKNPYPVCYKGRSRQGNQESIFKLPILGAEQGNIYDLHQRILEALPHHTVYMTYADSYKSWLCGEPEIIVDYHVQRCCKVTPLNVVETSNNMPMSLYKNWGVESNKDGKFACVQYDVSNSQQLIEYLQYHYGLGGCIPATTDDIGNSISGG